MKAKWLLKMRKSPPINCNKDNHIAEEEEDVVGDGEDVRWSRGKMEGVNKQKSTADEKMSTDKL